MRRGPVRATRRDRVPRLSGRDVVEPGGHGVHGVPDGHLLARWLVELLRVLCGFLRPRAGLLELFGLSDRLLGARPWRGLVRTMRGGHDRPCRRRGMHAVRGRKLRPERRDVPGVRRRNLLGRGLCELHPVRARELLCNGRVELRPVRAGDLLGGRRRDELHRVSGRLLRIEYWCHRL